MTEAPTIRDRVRELRRIPARDLIPNAKNWREHPQGQAAALLGVLAEIGYADALIGRDTPDGVQLLDGHLRAETTPDAIVPVLIVDLDDAEADKFLLSFDPITNLAEANKDLLAELLASARFESDAVNGMLEDLARKAHLAVQVLEGNTDPDAVPAAPDEPITQPGDLWLLGEHRLLCGDSTNVTDVERLMNGERAILFATDPPYLVDYDGMNHPHKWNEPDPNKDWSESYGRKWDESKSPESATLYHDFLATAIAVAIDDHAAWYCWHAGVRSAMVQEAWEEAGAFVHQQIIWVKDRPILTHGWYMWQHEPCFFGWIRGNKPPRRSDEHPRSVWEIPTIRAGEKTDHPTSKPVRVFEIPMEQHTRKGDLCYEPFSGSGSQIIAAERLGRRCYAMELEPRYVDVAVRRWEEFTGRKAELVNITEVNDGAA